MGREATEYLPLKPTVFQLLLLLVEDDKHGYRLVKELQERYRDGRRILPGNLYRTLGTMRDDGLIEHAARPLESDHEDRRRRYFRVTALGRRVAEAELARIEELADQARALDLTPRTPERGR